MAKKVPVDDKLGYNNFHTDESCAHIEINSDFKDEEEIRKVVLACPAELDKYENGELAFNHEGCLECGTCRVVSGGKVVKSWNHPYGEMGVTYMQG
jgi:ferredoxin like protein